MVIFEADRAAVPARKPGLIQRVDRGTLRKLAVMLGLGVLAWSAVLIAAWSIVWIALS
jgi:hypothetical protein